MSTTRKHKGPKKVSKWKAKKGKRKDPKRKNRKVWEQ